MPPRPAPRPVPRPVPRPAPQHSAARAAAVPAVVAVPVSAAAPLPIQQTIAETATLARELLDVLRREAQALATMKLEAPTGFAEAKNRLIAAYAYKLEELREVDMAPAAEPALGELRHLNDEVLAAARQNAAVLEGAMAGNKRLLEIVVKAAGQQRAPATVGYGRIGNRAVAPRHSGAAGSLMITRNL